MYEEEGEGVMYEDGGMYVVGLAVAALSGAVVGFVIGLLIG